jgi:hypothetical protein
VKVYLVYDENSHNDGYAMNHGIFATEELAKEFIKIGFDDYDEDKEELQENAQIEEFELI